MYIGCTWYEGNIIQVCAELGDGTVRQHRKIWRELSRIKETESLLPSVHSVKIFAFSTSTRENGREVISHHLFRTILALMIQSSWLNDVWGARTTCAFTLAERRFTFYYLVWITLSTACPHFCFNRFTTIAIIRYQYLSFVTQTGRTRLNFALHCCYEHNGDD